MKNLDYFIQNFIDVFKEQIAVVDQDGVIQYTNPSWDTFHLEKMSQITPVFIGDSYLRLLKESGNTEILEGINNVVNRTLDEYIFPYSSYSFSNKSCYQMTVRRCLLNENYEGLVFINRDITNWSEE